MKKRCNIRVDAFSQDAPKLVNMVNIPILTSLDLGWQGISLFFHRQPSMETSEYRLEQHCITIPTHPVRHIEEKLDGKLTTANFQLQQISITPADHLAQYRWIYPIEVIQLAIDPTVLRLIAYETIHPEKVELIPNFIQIDPLIYQIGISLKNEIISSGYKCKLYAESTSIFLCSHLLQKYASVQPVIKNYGDGLSSKALKNALDYIQANLGEDISIKLIADQAQMSQYYFSRLFKQSMGVSPHKYVIQQRVLMAKTLLKSSRMPISEVTTSCGFANQSHLTKHFKTITGETPKQFRKIYNLQN